MSEDFNYLWNSFTFSGVISFAFFPGLIFSSVNIYPFICRTVYEKDSFFFYLFGFVEEIMNITVSPFLSSRIFSF